MKTSRINLKNKKKKFGLLLCLVTSCILLFAFVLAPTDIDISALNSGKSVVVIHTNGKVSGYGVAYGGEGKIVTALHVVAGKSRIQVAWNGKKADAVIDRTHREADLAMLRFTADWADEIAQMQAYSGKFPSEERLNYWVSRPGSITMERKTTELQDEVALSNFNPRLKPASSFAKVLCSAGNSPYPALSTEVLKFEEHKIKKKHSGTPLTYNGQIVGMVDGGANINAKSCVWAIPARELKMLKDHGSTSEKFQPCYSTNLYSGLRSDNPFLTEKERDYARMMESSSSSLQIGDFNFQISFIATFEEIFENLLEKEKKVFTGLFKIGDFTLEDFANQRIKVYEDENSGATIVVPYQTSFKDSKIGNQYFSLESKSPLGYISMQVLAFKTGEGNGLNAIEMVKGTLLKDPEWEKEKDEDGEVNEDEYDNDPEEDYYSLEMYRIKTDSNNEETDDLSVSLIVEEGDFLGAVIEGNNWDEIYDNNAELKFYILAEVCAYLTDFSYY